MSAFALCCYLYFLGLLLSFYRSICRQQSILVVNIVQDGKAGPNTPMAGGETEALQRLKRFAAECVAQPNKGFKDGTQSIYGANFSCKISPWLAMGCLSPREMFDELKKTASRCGPNVFFFV